MIQPIEYNVLIKLDEIKKKTDGGILLSDTTIEADKHAQQRGTIAAMSPFAFSYAEWPGGLTPKVGDRVFFARYEGVLFTEGEDEFRLVKDKAIAAVIE